MCRVPSALAACAATGQTSILIGNTCARTIRLKACQTPRPSEVLSRLEADQIVSAQCDGFRDYLMMRWARAEERTRQTKGAATDMFGLQPLRHISSRRASLLS